MFPSRSSAATVVCSTLVGLLLAAAQAGPAAPVDAGAAGMVLPAETARADASEQTSAGRLYVEPSTLHSLGFEWEIEGDENRNGRVGVRYRLAGQPAWKPAMDLLRIRGEHVGVLIKRKAPDYRDYVCGNLFAGSLLFLEPGTRYEVELTLADPDNGPDPVAVRSLFVATKAVPQPAAAGRRLHVYPPGFGGRRDEPHFEDLGRAYREAEPGDRILLHAGRYGETYTFDKQAPRDRPIVIRAAGDGEVVFQGDAEGNVTRVPIADRDQTHWHENASCFDVSRAAGLWIEGITFRHYDIPIHSDERGTTRGLTVCRSTFEDHGTAGVLIRSTACRDVLITDCVFRGTQGTWRRKEAKPFPYKGVWLAGQGVDVCYNRVQNFKDGISVFQPGGIPTRDFSRKMAALDFHHNDVGQCWDDNEADGGQHNVRFFLNRLVDQHVGLSAQPVYGGPCYFVRNVLYNVTRGVPFKLNCQPAGVLIFHNTCFGQAKLGSGWYNVHARNNLFADAGPVSLTLGPFDPDRSALDYNGYTPGGEVLLLLPDGDLRFRRSRNITRLEELAEKLGYERHRVGVQLDDFVDVKPPPGESKTHHDLEFGDPRLKAGSRAIDAGALLPNVNDDFSGRGPDLGAYEHGRSLPHYGPREIGD